MQLCVQSPSAYSRILIWIQIQYGSDQLTFIKQWFVIIVVPYFSPDNKFWTLPISKDLTDNKKPCSVERGLNEFVKSVNPYKVAQSMLKLSVIFSACPGTIQYHDLVRKLTKQISWFPNQVINSLPNDKILDPSKLKAFADNKINVIQKLHF